MRAGACFILNSGAVRVDGAGGAFQGGPVHGFSSTGVAELEVGYRFIGIERLMCNFKGLLAEAFVFFRRMFCTRVPYEGRVARHGLAEESVWFGAKRSQLAMNSAAITGPMTKPVRPKSPMPPSVEMSTM